ncbi:type II toxin-antitoxin system HicA family toxin [Spirosoma sp. BT702]|uniref:Type II toxin-antitoxin system HicA family toxin n=1 Tax=Spirosoma profusum TaxID=2771354 RepID=A0A927AWL1_9BACT|nr:type II toxin-antitoxin system HicA family toxin [Spirosoma profusum]MBD2705701.1 type II toxin-antitoxin system HicA family toxin [Spirosoma profusum]
MKTSMLITILKRAGWQQIRQVGADLLFSHPDHSHLISIPDLGKQPLKIELLNDIFKAAGLKARVRKLAFNPRNVWKAWQRLFSNLGL